MSIPSVLPLLGKTDSIALAGSIDGVESTAANDPAAGVVFDTELAQVADETAAPLPESAAEDEVDEATDALITCDDPLEAVLQAWNGISAEVAETKTIRADPPLNKAALQLPSKADAQPDTTAELIPSQQPDDKSGDVAELAGPEQIVMEKPALPPRLTTSVVDEATSAPLRMEGEVSPRHATVPTAPDAASLRAQPAPLQVIRQISDAFVATRDDQIDIALSPEELGRIRMTISGRDGGQHIVIWAERPEVLDQLRRNTSSLMHEFSEAGMEDLSFEFRDDRPDQRDADWQTAQVADSAPDMPFIPPTAQTPGYGTLALGPRIDIRI